MKPDCTNGTDQGKDLDIYYWVPDQDEIDEGKKPEIVIDCLKLMCEVEAGTSREQTVGLFMIDAEKLFLDDAFDAEQAEAIALWLEDAAEAVRNKFKTV